MANPCRCSGPGVREGDKDVDQLHASLSPGKQSEPEERRSALVMRGYEEDGEDGEDGAPPRSTVDLRGGTAVIRLRMDETRRAGT
ncbi:DUF6191 domain-containing protein [Streptomyces chartreusis]|uniref:DUF6191 domain-containing protein n=1 Tax=Streptomyces chartreusis TaxID=1969 RepID=UPI003F4D8CFC